MMSEIMLVPLPRAASRRLISFLTFHISMFFSASAPCPWGGADMAGGVDVQAGVFVGSGGAEIFFEEGWAGRLARL
jgi:hypothetical protein